MTAYDPDNIFAKILRGEMPAVKVHEDDTALAIMDVFPQTRGHVLVIPKAASRNLLDADPAAVAAAIPLAQRIARAQMAALGADGVRFVQFNEEPAGQTVFHLHFHLLPVYEGEPLGRHAGGEAADQAELQALAEKIAAAL